jgi:hypothetical protein
MSLVDEQAAFLLDVCKLITFATSSGFTVTGGELARTEEQQALYVKAGKSKTMDSNHLRRCAIDLNFFKDGKLTYDIEVLRPIGGYWESLNPKNSWGGFWKSFKDIPHFERRP